MTEEPRARRRWGRWGCGIAAGLVVVSLAILPFCPCGKGLPELHGVVVDWETGEPLADARIDRWAQYVDVVYGPGGASVGNADQFETTTDDEGRFSIPALPAPRWHELERIRAGIFVVFESGWGVVRVTYGESGARIRGVLPNKQEPSEVRYLRRGGDASALGGWFDTAKVEVQLNEEDVVIPLVELHTTEQWEEQFDYMDRLDRFPMELRAKELLRYLNEGGMWTEQIVNEVWWKAPGVAESRPELAWDLYDEFAEHCRAPEVDCRRDALLDLKGSILLRIPVDGEYPPVRLAREVAQFVGEGGSITDSTRRLACQLIPKVLQKDPGLAQELWRVNRRFCREEGNQTLPHCGRDELESLRLRIERVTDNERVGE